MAISATVPATGDFAAWAAQLPRHWRKAQRAALQRAYELSGDGLEAAELLLDLKLDIDAVLAALLYPQVAAGTEPAALAKDFGPAVAVLLEGVDKLNTLGGFHQQRSYRDEQLENLRKMLLVIAKDVRVVLIALALRVCKMRHIDSLAEPLRRDTAQETLDLFAPLANRLGIGQLKWELEDRALRILDPLTYKSLAKALYQRRSERERYIAEVVGRLRAELGKLQVSGEVYGRAKHIYSIWRKMQRKRLPFEQIFDVHAVRVTVHGVAECYTVLGAVHGLWSNIPQEFDDYIANPKPNGYQSLHTAVVGPHNKTVEVQIRTHAMHRHAEYGVAAHWRYKEGDAGQSASFERHLDWLRQLLEYQDSSAEDIIDQLKTEAFQDRVYVLTPKGEIVDLAHGATPLDFAYHIHTDIGHRCRGAKINGKIVPLTTTLSDGDQVDILTAKEGQPSRDWLSPHLGYLTTSRARAKVRHWFRLQDRDKNIAAGKTALDQAFQRLDVNVKELDLLKIAEQFNFGKVDDLYVALGNGDLGTATVAAAAQESILPPAAEDSFKLARRHRHSDSAGVTIRGVGDLLTQMAGCCQPLPPEPIVGFITHGRGVTIHRQDCSNVPNFAEERLIEVDWGDDEQAYAVDIVVEALDRQGLWRDVTALLANAKINILALNSSGGHLEATLAIHDLGQLSRVLDKINQLPNVLSVRRKVGSRRSSR